MPNSYVKKYKDDKIRTEYLQQQKILSKINKQKPVELIPIKQFNQQITSVPKRNNQMLGLKNSSNLQRDRDQRNDDDLLDCILDMKQPPVYISNQVQQQSSKRTTSFSSNLSGNNAPMPASSTVISNSKAQQVQSQQVYSQRFLNKQVSFF